MRDVIYYIFPDVMTLSFYFLGNEKEKQARWIYCSVFSSRADDAETTTKTRTGNTLLQGKTWEFLFSPNSTKLSRKLHNHAVLFYRLCRREAGKSQAVGLPAGAASRLRMGPYWRPHRPPTPPAPQYKGFYSFSLLFYLQNTVVAHTR